MKRVSKTEKVRRAFTKNPNANPQEVAAKLGVHSSICYKMRKQLATDEGPKPARRKVARESVTFVRRDADTRPTRSPLASQVMQIESIGVERVKAILGLLES